MSIVPTRGNLGLASEPENKKKGTGDSPREPTKVSRVETLEESRSSGSREETLEGSRSSGRERMEWKRKKREIGVHELTHGIQ